VYIIHVPTIPAEMNVYIWGGQHDRDKVAKFKIGPIPILVEHMSSQKSVRVVRGYQHGLSLGQDGRVVVGGYNNFGQMGTGDRRDVIYNEVRELTVFNDMQVVFLGCGDNHSFVLTN
jgi:alpha-tubulin suppressor-like RCC1 family protein